MRACVIRAARDLSIEPWAEPALQAGEVRLDLAWGGICGSDLHYFQHGRVANSILREPMILGHEFSGRIREVGPGVQWLKPGMAVAVNPSRPCGSCDQCSAGLTHLCRSMRFMGSAAHFPHTHGGFAERPVVLASQCVALPETVDLALAALSEPYAVALHAVELAQIAPGASVLVTGAGTIGSLVAVAARQAGAGRLIVTDIAEPALARVRNVTGAETHLVGDPEATRAAEAAIGEVDVVLEASGVSAALDMAIRCIRPRGRIVQVGFLPPEAKLSLAGLLIREATLVGAYRFLGEFDEAVRQISTGAVDLAPFVTARFGMDAAEEAFAAAADRTHNVKVLLSFGS
ncbi:L-idonate 5-dehydrogenase [Cereibacter sphaeroides]|uniref:L-idonate 5-dehydrogenase n=1 Tax=Cereibacter sphaeroides TaxID=1063 RepID=UPI000F546577|nr:L-idonate 5-dehydrogenase [Cereibacter sphaeroides]AZB61334.1 L-idonate 5-dehydrogenase [Cereibacter sphaeroides]